MTSRQLLILLFLGAMFGASFLYMRVAAPVLGPWVVAFVRVGLAAALLALVVRGAGLRAVARDWRPLLFLGAVNSALPFGMYAFAEQTIDASLAAILNALAPATMAVASALWLAQPLTTRKVVGIALGVGGVATVVGLGHVELDLATAFAIGACLLAVTGYAIGFTFARRRLPHLDPVTISFGQSLWAAIVLMPGAVLTLPAVSPGPEVILALVALATFSTALAWPLLFNLVAAIGPTASSTVTLLAPAFGIVWGSLVLGEPIGPTLLVGTTLILVSVALIVGLRPSAMRAALARNVDRLWTSAPGTLAKLESRG
jgi:drug/metabolite transporter (DMT)-like permease